MAEIRVAPDESSAEIVLDPGERLASTSLANILLARAGVRVGIDHASLASLADVVGPVAVRVAVGGPGRSVMGRALPTAASAVVRPVAAIDGEVGAADGLIQVAGDIRVTGDVGVHAVIVALGDVHVGGDLAGGRILAGGRVVVTGAISRESVVEAGGNVSTVSVEAATIRTDGALEVAGDVVRSTIEAGALRVAGRCVASEVVVTGAVAISALDDEPGTIVAVARPQPRAVAQTRAARRVDVEAQLAKLRPMAEAPALEASTRAKVAAAIASLEARLRELR